MNKLILPFERLGSKDVGIAGGKGASLGEMTQAGIPVPSGFVILSESFERFIKETDLVQEIDAILHKVNHKEIHTVEAASEEIRELILNAEMPKDIADEIHKSFKELNAKYVAVRSSATAEDGKDHAWAGQLESYLNTMESEVLTKVKLCWSSLFTPRAIFYRFEKSLHSTKISVAVVIQKMVESEISGIAFSVHPVTEDRNQLIIEAGFGLGEAIVSGSVTPDSYVVEKNPRNILDINVSTQNRGLYRSEKTSAEHGNNEWRDISEPKASSQVITKKQILELSEIILNIENHYGFPCDIEWAYEAGKFYVVQSRPITTLGFREQSKNEKKNPLIVDGIEWYMTVTRNMSFWHQDLANEGLFSLTKEYGIDAKLEVLAIVTNGTRTNAFMHHSNYAQYADAVMKKVSTAQGVEDLKKKYKQFAKEVFESLDQCLNNINVVNWNKFLENYTRLSAGLMITATIGRSGGDLLTKKLKDLGYEDAVIPDMIGTITYPQEHTPLFDSQLGLLEIGKKVQIGIPEKEKKELLNKWLGKFGSIPANFCDDPWNENDALSQLNSALTKDCDKEFISAEQNHKKRIVDSKVLLKKIDNNEVTALAYAVAEGTYLNEFRKNVFCKTSVSYRPIFQKIAELGGSTNWRDCFFMRSTEMTELLEGKKIFIPKLIKQRDAVGVYRTERAVNKMLDQDIVNGFVEYIESMHGSNNVKAEGITSVKGHSANKGKVRGIVRIILGSKDFHKLNPGEILVTTMTSVDFVPVMERAAAFVTNEGGITSHASIVAREMNKPCIIGTKNATQILKDGDMVEVDANNGLVSILE